MNSKRLRIFQTTVLDWYMVNKREFLWRKETPEPFITLVSEVMLQQTQTSRVEEKLPEFLRQFPTITALANASNAEIIRAWKGLGYNNRALRIRDAARSICELHSGTIPQTLDDLLALSGIGRYTATAIMAFSYRCDVAVVDVNIRRVYSRLFFRMETTSSVASESEINKLSERIFPKGHSSDWHQAIMDIGSQFCTAKRPDCSNCPLFSDCLSAGKMMEFTPAKRAEPSYNKIPRRIWRGKIVDLLRQTHSMSFETMVDSLFGEKANDDDRKWLLEIISILEKDSMIVQDGNTLRLKDN